MIKLQISMLVTPQNVTAAGGIDNLISKTKDTFFKAYGNDRLCSGQFYKSTVVNVSKILLNPTRRQLAEAVQPAVCKALATSYMTVSSKQVYVVQARVPLRLDS